MPTRELLSDAQRARFSALPDMDARELARHHTLSEADLTAVSIRGGRRRVGGDARRRPGAGPRPTAYRR